MKLLQAARLSRLGNSSTGLDKQDEASQRYSDAFEHEIIGVAADTDVSGNTRPADRPKLGPWLTDPLLINLYDGIIAAHLDRFGRNVRHLAELHAWADEHNKKLITVEPNIDWSSDVGKLIWGIMSWLAEQELKSITRRNKETQSWLKSNGFLVGPAPFGYEVTLVPESGRTGKPEDDHKTLRPIEKLVPVIQEMADRAIRGDTLTSICKWLNESGVKTPSGKGLWFPQNLSYVLRNESLAGRRLGCRDPEKCKNIGGRHPNCEKVTRLKFEAIINPTRFNELQEKLNINASRKGTQPATSLLSGIIHCAKCRRAMHQKEITNRYGTKYLYYRCGGTTEKPSTCKNLIVRADVERWIDSYFTVHMGDQERYVKVVVHGSNHRSEIEQIDRDIDELDRDAEDYITRVSELIIERKRVQALPTEPDIVTYEATGETMKEYWSRLDESERRGLMLDDRMKLYATKNSYELMVDDKIIGSWRPLL